MNFSVLKQAVAKQFERMQKHSRMFRVNIEKDDIWNKYIGSFPAGTNPLYRERSEHACSCCKQFIRTIGDCVAIIDGKIETIWDISVPSEPGYQAVADALSALIKSKPIGDVFLHYERLAGTGINFEQLVEGAKMWEHFSVNIQSNHVAKNAEIATILGGLRSTHDVFFRALTEITTESIDTVLELIAQGSLYRGTEHEGTVKAFEKLKKAFMKLKTNEQKDIFVWTSMDTVSGAVASIRSSVIGSLLVDLSKEIELEDAVKMFESKVAPANYKRPTAVITKGMRDKAKKELETLGLVSALERRYATINDITINNILFANREAKKVLTSDIFDELPVAGTNAKKFDKVEEVSIEDFIAKILPKAESIEVLIENKHASNLVSLIAPADPTAGDLFKWPNKFSWSYSGELADSDMRKAVQERGGRVDGVFRFTHSWNYDKRNASLMDLHVFMPGNHTLPENGFHDTYGNSDRVGWNNRSHYKSGGVQDVDYTPEAPVGYIPVENITFPTLSKMPEGRYICKVHNWNLRSPTQGGFKAEIEFGGQVFQYEYDKPMKNKEWVTVAEVTLKAGQFTIKHHLPESASSKKVWGLQTNEFSKVEVMMLSPNFWDEKAVGNKHYFFMLDGCINNDTARGFFNEFLKEELNVHRKVFEMVGSKMKVDDSSNQLSGLGFSSTQKNTLICKVKGSFARTIKIVF